MAFPGRLSHSLFILPFLPSCHSSASRGDDHDWDEIWITPDKYSVTSIHDDLLWHGHGTARVLSGTFGTGSATSALVIDGVSEWHTFSRELHRSTIAQAKNLMTMTAGDGSPPNAYAIDHGGSASALLDRLRDDSAVRHALARHFHVELLGCKAGRSTGQDPLLIVQNATMPSDNFHTDICDDDVAGHTGITVLTYPHDRWESHWRGHLELGTPSNKVVASLAPLQNRTIIFDGCIRHRATNPVLSALPLQNNIEASHSFQNIVGIGNGTSHFEFVGWRFATSMQLRCPLQVKEDKVSKPLAIKMERSLEPSDLLLLQHMRKLALESDISDRLVENREFGVGGAGHETVFLHSHFDDAAPHLRTHLRKLAVQAYDVGGWGAIAVPNLTTRCLEAIRYVGGREANSSDHVGWHGDGGTLLTFMVMLSKPDQYNGGAVELKDGNMYERHELELGDSLAWRGWTLHRVTPVTWGLRDVFIVEWWLGQDCTISLDPRSEDNIEDLRYALRLDPSSPNLHRYIGEHLCEQLPCSDSETETIAEASYRQAVALSPGDATTAYNLGNFLVGSPRIVTFIKGILWLRHANLLDPSVVPPLPEDWAIIAQIVENSTKLLAGLAVVALLMWLLWKLEAEPATNMSKASESDPKADSKALRSGKKTN